MTGENGPLAHPEDTRQAGAEGVRVTRRQLLRWGALASLAVPVLAACGGGGGGGARGTSTPSGAPPTGQTPTSGAVTKPTSAATGAVPTGTAGAAPIGTGTPAIGTPAATTTVTGQATMGVSPSATVSMKLTKWQPRFKQKATLSRFGFGTDNPTAKIHVELFQKTYPNITLQVTPEVTDQKILTAVASGDVPDLFWLDRSTIMSWAARNALEPLDDLIKGDNRFDIKQFYPTEITEVQYQNKTWAVPQFIDCRPLWLNAQPFKEAGIDINSVKPSDWNQLASYGKKLEKKSGSKISRWGFDPKAQDDSFFWMWCWANGGDLLSQDGRKATINTPENVQALEYCVNTMNAQGGIQAHDAFMQTTGFEGKQNFFVQDQVGMTLYESWLLGIIGEGGPDHQFKVIPFTDKKGNVLSLTGGNAWAIPKGAKNRDAAWEWISFMSAPSIWVQEEQIKKKQLQSQKQLYVPSITGNQVADRMILSQVFTTTGNRAFDDAIRLFPQLIAKNRRTLASPVLKQFSDTVHDTGVMPALQGTKKPKDSLADAQSKAQSALDSFYKK